MIFLRYCQNFCCKIGMRMIKYRLIVTITDRSRWKDSSEQPSPPSQISEVGFAKLVNTDNCYCKMTNRNNFFAKLVIMDNCYCKMTNHEQINHEQIEKWFLTLSGACDSIVWSLVRCEYKCV